MKCLTVRQPWATLIVRGLKLREYRPWSPAGWVVLPARIAIHSAATEDRSPEALAALITSGIDPDARNFPLGVVLGEVTITGARLVSQLDALARYGRVAWLLGSPIEYREKLPARGQLGLWDLDRGIIAAL